MAGVLWGGLWAGVVQMEWNERNGVVMIRRLLESCNWFAGGVHATDGVWGGSMELTLSDNDYAFNATT